MTDVFSVSERSALMARIRGRGNKATEMEFVTLLRRHKIAGWRRQVSLPLPRPKDAPRNAKRPRARPDFVFPKSKVAIFVDGCFWHGCPAHFTAPASNVAFWRVKLATNRTRDRHVSAALQRQGWLVLRFWEHQLRYGDRVIARLRVGLERA